jgi:hypothetical protein
VAENVNVVSSGPTREQVSVIARDPELRKLRPASPEYQAAFAKKFPINGTNTSASAAEVKEEKVKTNEVSGQTEASTDDESADDKALSAKAQKRIATLVKERNLEKAERSKLEARIAQLENAGKTPQQAAKQAKAETQANTAEYTKPKPKLSDFDNIEAYNEAYFDWKTDKRDYEQEQKSKVKTAQESGAKVMTKFYDEGSKLEKELGLGEGDFRTLTSDLGFKTPPTTIEAIVESPFGAKIALELANLDDSEKERVGRMTAVQQVAYIGKLEAKFESKRQQVTETVSAAKAPGKPLKKGTGSATSTTVSPGMSFKEYEAARKAQRPDKFRR